MEAYKHSCPFCGQHIEYTVEYCGTRIVCPSCGQSITFPAIPPGSKGTSLHVKRSAAAAVPRWSFDIQGILAFLSKCFGSKERSPTSNSGGVISSVQQFKHWNTVFLCLAPFVIVGALLVGADELRKKAGNGPAVPAVPLVQADPNAWQNMTDLAHADQLVQTQVGVVARAYGAFVAAQRTFANMQTAYRGKPLDSLAMQSEAQQSAQDQQAINCAQQTLNAARQSFENAFQNYQKLGGTIDYRQQLPQ
jgi:hypothetical protein